MDALKRGSNPISGIVDKPKTKVIGNEQERPLIWPAT